MNIIQTVRGQCQGLVLGWGVPEEQNQTLVEIFPRWALTFTPRAPAFVTFDDYANARRETRVPREHPVIALGIGEGCTAIRCLAVSGFLNVAKFVTIQRPQVPEKDLWIWERVKDRLLVLDTFDPAALVASLKS
jgi:hypothetical protein